MDLLAFSKKIVTDTVTGLTGPVVSACRISLLVRLELPDGSGRTVQFTEAAAERDLTITGTQVA